VSYPDLNRLSLLSKELTMTCYHKSRGLNEVDDGRVRVLQVKIFGHEIESAFTHSS